MIVATHMFSKYSTDFNVSLVIYYYNCTLSFTVVSNNDILLLYDVHIITKYFNTSDCNVFMFDNALLFSNSVDPMRNHYSDLVGTIQDPAGLAASLYSRGIISLYVRDEIQQRGDLTTKSKNEILLNAVEAQMAIDPAMFQVFMEVLKEEPSLRVLGECVCGRIAALIRLRGSLHTDNLYMYMYVK